jgi:tricorn protease-like protein
MRVLVVEDERKIAAYVKRGLEEQGYAVDIADTGHEALDWVETVEFDLEEGNMRSFVKQLRYRSITKFTIVVLSVSFLAFSAPESLYTSSILTYTEVARLGRGLLYTTRSEYSRGCERKKR